MAYRYLALVNGADAQSLCASVEHRLRAMQMRPYLRSPWLTLYASDTTPVLLLDERTAVLGHLFSRQGIRISDATQLPRLGDPAALRRHILDRCWGAYLIVQLVAGQRGLACFTRDPEGGMPCFHRLSDGSGFLASDVALPDILGIHRRSIDWDAMVHRAAYPSIKTGRTGLEGICELLPGTRLDVRGSLSAIETEWSPWGLLTDRYRERCSLHEAATAIREAVTMVVKAWSSVDRSILLELSGGLDSSIVGTSLQGSEADVTCFNMATPVPGADERRYAGQVAALLDSHLHTETLDLESIGPDFTQQAPTAIPRTGMLQHATDTVMENARQRHGATSFFSGGGGDTVFCYLMNAAPAADAYRQGGLRTAALAVRDLATLHQCTIWKAGRLALRKLRRPPASPYRHDTRFISRLHAERGPDAHPWLDSSDRGLPGERERVLALVVTQTYRDSAPRGQLAHLRLPLLSQPVVEATMRVPSWMWIAGGRNRSVARRAFADVLPPDVLNRRSKGSFTGYVGALYARHRLRLREMLLDGHLRARGILDGPALQRFMDRELAPRDDSFARVMDLCAIENWIRRHC